MIIRIKKLQLMVNFLLKWELVEIVQQLISTIETVILVKIHHHIMQV